MSSGKPDLTSTTFNNQLAIVIPTKDRPRQLEGLLSSLMNQSYRPDQTIIVDGGDEPVRWVAQNSRTSK